MKACETRPQDCDEIIRRLEALESRESRHLPTPAVIREESAMRHNDANHSLTRDDSTNDPDMQDEEMP